MASGDFYSTLGIEAAVGRTFSRRRRSAGRRPGRNGCRHQLRLLAASIRWRPLGHRQDGAHRSPAVHDCRRRAARILRCRAGTRAGHHDSAHQQRRTQRALAQPSTSSWLHLMGRLRDGVSHEQANVALQQIWPAVLEATTSPGKPADRRAKYLGRQTTLEPGSAGFSRVRRQFGEPLLMLFALVGLLFAVACASAANLLLARGVARQREIAVRLAIGASRARLVRQLFTESLVSAALAGALGIARRLVGGGGLVAMMTSRESPIVLDVSSELARHALRARADARHGRGLLGASRAPCDRLAPGCNAQRNGTRLGTPLPALVARKGARRLAGGGDDGAAGGGGAVRPQPDKPCCRRTPASIATRCSSSRPTRESPATRTSG